MIYFRESFDNDHDQDLLIMIHTVNESIIFYSISPTA